MPRKPSVRAARAVRARSGARVVAKRPAPSATIPPLSAPEADALRKVAAMAEFRAIIVKSLSASREDSIAVGVKLQATNEFRAAATVRESNLFITLRFKYRTVPATMDLEVAFNLHYTLRDAATDADADIFARHNALFNAWPYWRELVQSTAQRMGIVAPAIPLLRAT